jgi:hypothetical protein
MVDVRCLNFNDVVWAYVAEYASRKNVPRCKALENIVIEHMRFVAMMAEEAKLTTAKKKG